jgi:hypothetical protein
MVGDGESFWAGYGGGMMLAGDGTIPALKPPAVMRSRLAKARIWWYSAS